MLPMDVIERAKQILNSCEGGSMGMSGWIVEGGEGWLHCLSVH